MLFTYKFHCFPTKEQASKLNKTFDACRFVSNKCLDSYNKMETTANFFLNSKKLTELKKNEKFKWLNDVSSVPLQQAIKEITSEIKTNLQFNRGWTSFKRLHALQEANYVKSAFKFKNGKLKLSKIGEFDVTVTREMETEPSSVRLTKDRLNNYFALFTFEKTVVELPPANRSVEISFNNESFLLVNEKKEFSVPEQFHYLYGEIKRREKVITGMRKGGKDVRAQVEKLQRIFTSFRRVKREFYHKISNTLVKNYDTIIVKNWNPDTSIGHEYSLNYFKNILEDKCKSTGRVLVKTDAELKTVTSCFKCNYMLKNLPETSKRYDCNACGFTSVRDLPTAKGFVREASFKILKYGKLVKSEPVPYKRPKVGLTQRIEMANRKQFHRLMNTWIY